MLNIRDLWPILFGLFVVNLDPNPEFNLTIEATRPTLW